MKVVQEPVCVADERVHSRTRRAAIGFTLVELLVVIAILAILAAILLPTLNRSVEQSRGIACLNNLRQLQLCWHMYADENEGTLPPNNYRYHYSGGKTTPPARNESWCPGNARQDLTTANIEKGVLFPYHRSPSIYRCPSDRSFAEDELGNPLGKPRTRSYNMSASVNCELTAGQIPTYKKYSEILSPSPARFFVFIDEHEDIMYDAHFGLWPATSRYGDYWFDQPSDRHLQGANLSFADGHVEHWRWAYPKKVQVVPQLAANSQDLKDMRRLQACMKPAD